MNQVGKSGEPGDKHFKCLHGAQKFMPITRSMCSSLNGEFFSILIDSIINWTLGLTQHLCVHFPAMYRLYTVLKLQGSPPSDDELSMAQGKKTLDPNTADQYLISLEKASNNLDQIFQSQAMANVVCPFSFLVSILC